MSLVLRTTALKIVNKGGGLYLINNGGRPQSLKKDTGSDYVTFICPHPNCGRRQKQCMYDAEAYHLPEEDRIPFKCKFCRNTIEVTRPYSPLSLLVTPAEFTTEMAQRRRELAVNSTKLGRT